MCRHTAATVVAADFEGEPVAIYQCDLCGLTLPEREPPDGGPPTVLLDERALAFAVQHAIRQANRWMERLAALRQTDRAAYRAEVRRALGAGTACAGDEGRGTA